MGDIEDFPNPHKEMPRTPNIRYIGCYLLVFRRSGRYGPSPVCIGAWCNNGNYLGYRLSILSDSGFAAEAIVFCCRP